MNRNTTKLKRISRDLLKLESELVGQAARSSGQPHIATELRNVIATMRRANEGIQDVAWAIKKEELENE